MLTILSEIKFLTARDDVLIKENDFGVFKYTDRKSTQKTQYSNAKDEYAQALNYTLKSKNIGYSIRKLEESLQQNRVVYCSWTDNVAFKMMLSNGLLVHICIDSFTGEIVRMTFDKFLIGKLVSEDICDVIMTRMHILISYDVNQITFVYLQKPSLKKQFKKIRKMDPKIFTYIISGSHSKKISRHLTCNNCYDLLAVWTKSSQNEVYPWRPTFRDQDRANIHIYRLSHNKLDLICYYWTENDPINVEFSTVNQNQLRSIEQKVSRKGEVTIEICVYNVNGSKIQRTSVTSIPLQSQVCCHAFSPDNEKLMLGCIDGSVILFDEGRGITHLIKAAFIPTLVSWHSDSAIVMIANEKCQVQYFDISLACVRNQILNEDMVSMTVLELSSFITNQSSLLKFCCSKKPELNQYNHKYIQNDSFILAIFENGPIAVIRLFCGNGLRGDVHTSGFTADVLIHQYLKLGNVEKAINVLLCLNWDVYGAMLMISLHKIANYIFKQPFQQEREIQLQKALGSFFVPVKPLCAETKSEFEDQVKDIARKFFQYLLRNKSFEKAFTLAIDIDDEDLFMDLSNCAKENGCVELSNDSFQKAEQIFTRSDSRQSLGSTCSNESCYGCITNSESSEEYQKSSTDFKTTDVPISDETRIRKNLKNSNEANAPTKVLKVSHFSKSLFDNTDFESKTLETDKRFENAKPRTVKPTYVQNKLRQDKQIERSQTSTLPPQILRVVDVVPRSHMSGHHVLDQTIGIPVKNTLHHRGGCQSILLNSDLHYNFAKTLPNVTERHLISDKILNDARNEPQIIHHPLISGNIPASFNTAQNRESKTILLPKTYPHESVNVSTANRGISSQQTSSTTKRENGERNKVKFCSTVTVAVVPDIPDNRIKKTMSKFNSRRELQDSLPIHNPNEDYLKDFTPVRHHSKSSTSKEGELTWV